MGFGSGFKSQSPCMNECAAFPQGQPVKNKQKNKNAIKK